MKIQSMFQKDIDRPINGVVKVMQDDQQSLKDELSEYIITKELRRHFATFFDNYVKAIDTPTDKIGVWISGFFGSGKSHFLKMLSYLLSNKEVDGKHAFDYFADKFDDPMMYATVQKCVRIPTESILFNIDIEGPINKDKVDELANALQVCLDSGAKKVLLPITSAADLGLVPADLIGCFNLVFYQSAEDAVYKALGVE